MLQEFKSENFTDKDGNPAGGTAFATGISISWQNGPLGRGADRLPPNGAFVDTLLAIVEERILFYQEAAGGRFECRENRMALAALSDARYWLNIRTEEREARDVEGTHAQ